ncbi:MAG: thiamine-phosphate kinase [Gemmatimonadota bacterium]
MGDWSVALGPGREFDLIRGLLDIEDRLPPGVRMGSGDDCAILEGGVVVSVDLSVEEIHFRRDWLSLEEAGYRATAGALSDLAAMAADPLGVLLSMALAPGEAGEAARALQAGAREACRREGIQILGGDVSRSPGPVFLDVTVLGRTETPLLRKGSEVGDEVWVTGVVGGSAAALDLLARGETPTGPLRERWVRPQPRIREMRWLRERMMLHAGIDLSDGLAGDAGHLAAASDVALILEAERIPLDPEVGAVVRDSEDRLHFGLRGGEDYEVCFTAPPGEAEGVASEFRETFGVPITRIGRVEEGSGTHLQDPLGGVKALRGGFDHFTEEVG